MAHRFVLTAIATGSRILGRSFLAAYRQAQASSQYQRAQAKAGGASGTGGGAATSLSGNMMTLDEACKVLNVSKPPTSAVDVVARDVAVSVEEVLERYKRLFDANDPKKGGSFYLQSKVVNAKERLERELAPIRRKMEEAAEARRGPKIYKD